MTRADLDVICANVGGQAVITLKCAESLLKRLEDRNRGDLDEEYHLARCVCASVRSVIKRLPPLSKEAKTEFDDYKKYVEP